MKEYKYDNIILRHWDYEEEDVYQCVHAKDYPDTISVATYTVFGNGAQFTVLKTEGKSKYTPDEWFALIKDKLE